MSLSNDFAMFLDVTLTNKNIPLETRHQIKYLVDGAITSIEGKTWIGEAIAGLVTVEIDSDGKVKKTKLQIKGEQENQELIAEAFTSAYGAALKKRDEEVNVVFSEVQTKLAQMRKRETT